METTVEALEGNRVRLHVAVPASEFEKALDAAFRKLAAEIRVPGFRPGKAPRRLLEVRLGPEVAREQALTDALPEYYAEAVTAHHLDAIAAPEIDLTAGQEEGDVAFDAVVEVRPVVRLVGYDSLRVELPWKPVDDDAVSAQIDALRERFADLTDSDLPLTDGAYATIDIRGSVGGEDLAGLVSPDFLYAVGSGSVVPELDEQLHGTRPGAILEFTATLPERFGERSGEEVIFRVIVKEAKRKVLPDVTDEWVSESSEFDSVADLRDGVRRRLDMVSRVQAQMAVRDRVLEAAAGLVPVAPPETLVDQEVRGRIEDLAHRLSHADPPMSLEQYLVGTGQEPQALIDDVRTGAAGAVLADLALRAVVAQEQVEATEAEVDAEVFRLAERMQQRPDRLRRDLEKRGVLEAVRSDLARRKALEFLVERATVVDEQGEPIDLTIPEGSVGAETQDETGSETSKDENDERPEA